MPPAVSITLFLVFFGIFYAIMGQYAWAFHGGFTVGYMSYDLIHYYVHHGKPKSRMMKLLRRHHMSHHFNKKYKEKRFGVSNRIWDKLFKTI